MLEDDSLTELLRRIDSLLAARSLSDRKASMLATGNRSPDLIRNVRRGFAPKTDSLVALAGVLQTTPDYLIQALSPGATPTAAQRALTRSLRGVRVVGHVQAGDWREAFEWPAAEWYGITMVDDGRYAGVERAALEVRGDSMDQLYPDGSIVVIVRFGDIGRGPKSGERVVTIRRNDQGLYEATLKEFQEDPQGRQWLMPRSLNPEHRPFLLTSGDTTADVPSGAMPLVAHARSFDDGSEPDIVLFGLVVQSTRLE